MTSTSMVWSSVVLQGFPLAPTHVKISQPILGLFHAVPRNGLWKRNADAAFQRCVDLHHKNVLTPSIICILFSLMFLSCNMPLIRYIDYSATAKWTLFKTCMSREIILMRRNSFIYKFKTIQLFIIASITMTAFLRTRMEVDATHADEYLGSLFYSLIILLVDGFPELSMIVARLSVFYRQRELCFYPAWAYAIPAAIMKIPLSILESLVWVSLTYYVIGYSPEPGRFFRHLMLFFAVHWTSISMFRFLASVCRTTVAATLAGSMAIPLGLLFGGFIIPRPSMPFC